MVVIGHNSVLRISCDVNYLLTDKITSFILIPVHNHCYTINFLRLSVILVYTQGIHKRMVQFQKLTRIVFLTLHGHNVHRQQRQLSKFLMRYQQFASHAYCGVAGPVSKMASRQEKAFCVLRFEVSRSVITDYTLRFRKDAPCMLRLF